MPLRASLGADAPPSLSPSPDLARDVDDELHLAPLLVLGEEVRAGFGLSMGTVFPFMGTQSPSSVTGLLKAWGGGDNAALEKLVPLVDAELRRLARRYMGGEGRATRSSLPP